MARRYFGTDGVRGRVGDAPITPDFVMRLGHAAGKVLASTNAGGHDRPGVLVGKDTRISGYLLEASLQAGFTAAGVDVHLTGPLPTPGVAYLTRALRLSAGVVISASHNPFEDNGIKFFSSDGNKLPDETEEAIERLVDEPIRCAAPEQLGKAYRLKDPAGRYIEFCKSTVPMRLDLKGMKLVVDCAHGAAYQSAPHVFHELGADVVTLGDRPDGININDGVGAVHPKAMVAAVKKHKADLGLSLDGDADRIVICDGDGRLYDGDELLYVIVNDRLEKGPVAGVVGTLMTNFGFESAMRAAGIPFDRAKVGDRYVLEMLQAKGWLYGGENSGHLLALDCHTTGDGTISALQVVSAMVRSGRTLAELTADLRMLPQKMINVRVRRGFDWNDHEGLQHSKAAAEAELGERGRVLIRASGTEPVLRIMVEADTADRALHFAQSMADSLGTVAATD
jgi:phosphoglucosamine mutase